jgi:hypothetical protein
MHKNQNNNITKKKVACLIKILKKFTMIINIKECGDFIICKKNLNYFIQIISIVIKFNVHLILTKYSVYN